MKKIIPLIVFIGLTMSSNIKASSEYSSLADIRSNIDNVDGEIILLLKKRQDLVKAAASFKKDDNAVRDDKRVEAVINKVIDMANTHGLDPSVAENTYRAMIGSFINLELKEHRKKM